MWLRCDADCIGVAECTCETNPVGEELILCRNRNLNTIPHFTDPSNKLYGELNLEGNVITAIPDSAFKGIRIKRLLMHENNIISISDRAFVGLETVLEELYLTFDHATEIPSVAFTNLTNLKVLNFENYMKTHLPPNALSALSSLEKLTLTRGGLTSLVQSDLVQLRKLVYLNIGYNQFTDMPSCLRTQIGNLSTLRLDSNGIRNISRGALQGQVNLVSIDLSQNSFQFGIDRGSFIGLERSLQSFKCHTCFLTDDHLPAFISLGYLKELHLPDNSIQSFDRLLTGMTYLQVLDIHKNKVTTLTSSMFTGVSSSLQVLDFSENPLSFSVSASFGSLKQLRELQLNDIAGLKLDAQSFAEQRTTLKMLSLSGVSFSSTSQWSSAIGSLSALQTLVLSKANIQSIPEFTFQLNGQLSNIDLSNNNITSLTQRSLAGIQDSLVRIVLDHNQITTLNDCVFFQFTQLDFSQIGLINNPLKCDCSIKWLYDSLKNQNSQMEVRCDDGNTFLGKSSFFDSCSAQVPPSCKQLLPSTITSDTLNVTTGSDSPITDSHTSQLLSLEAIIGISLGAAAVIVIVVLAITAQRASKKNAAKSSIISPARTGSTRRFVRHSDPEQNPVDDSTAAIVQTLGQMSDEEKYRLVNLLTNSSGSLNNLDDGRRGSMRSPKGYIGRMYQKQPSEVSPDQHVYEEIPGEHYTEEIQLKRPPNGRLTKHSSAEMSDV